MNATGLKIIVSLAQGAIAFSEVVSICVDADCHWVCIIKTLGCLVLFCISVYLVIKN